MEKINDAKDNLIKIFKNINENTNKSFDTINNSGYGDLYLNFVFFFILAIVVINDLNEDPENKNNPFKRKEKEMAKLVISSLATLFVLGYIIFYVISSFTAPSWSSYYYVTLTLMLFAYIYITLSYSRLFNYAMSITFGLVVLVGLAMVFNVFSNYIRSFRGFQGFFIYFLFYIPCLISQFVEYVINEFKITTNAVLVLFMIELILLLIYFYLPYLLEQISIQDGTPVLERFVFLNNVNSYSMEDIVTFENNKTSVAEFGEKTINRNYALSMWVYLNNYSTSMAAYNKESLIFDYGNGKPKITYYNDQNEPNKMDVYRIYFSDKMDTSNYYELQIPNQKWNNFVFNYNSKYVDLFINGKLKRTFYFKQDIPEYNLSDIVTTGSENGLSGAIANIRYYSKKMTQRDISSMYNLLSNKNPPTNNL
tara:strand:- start:1340 stop:2608 length:1269 start_codon:yes stop_codon:yes gene_type:complete